MPLRGTDDCDTTRRAAVHHLPPLPWYPRKRLYPMAGHARPCRLVPRIQKALAVAQIKTPNYFDTYNSEGDGLKISSSIIGEKFTMSLICERCRKGGARAYIVNAADDNLARAVRFLMSDYGGHCARVHK